jgi:hypothetical protein
MRLTANCYGHASTIQQNTTMNIATLQSILKGMFTVFPELKKAKGQ